MGQILRTSAYFYALVLSPPFAMLSNHFKYTKRPLCSEVRGIMPR